MSPINDDKRTVWMVHYIDAAHPRCVDIKVSYAKILFKGGIIDGKISLGATVYLAADIARSLYHQLNIGPARRNLHLTGKGSY